MQEKCCLFVLLACFLLFPFFPGCSQEREKSESSPPAEADNQSDENSEDTAESIQEKKTFDDIYEMSVSGDVNKAIDLLANQDIEKSLRESSLESLKLSENAFMQTTNSEKTALQKEAIQVTKLVKQVSFKQVETLNNMKKELSEDSTELEGRILKLIQYLKSDDRLMLYQMIGKGIEKKQKSPESE